MVCELLTVWAVKSVTKFIVLTIVFNEYQDELEPNVQEGSQCVKCEIQLQIEGEYFVF